MLEVAGGADAVPTLRVVALRLVGAVPDPAYILRCLQLSDTDAAHLFSPLRFIGSHSDGAASGSEAQPLLGLAAALRPCDVARCAALRTHAAALSSRGAGAPLFKDPLLRGLAAEMRATQGWSKAKQKVGQPSPRCATLRPWDRCIAEHCRVMQGDPLIQLV